MRLPRTVEIWTDMRIQITNFLPDDIGDEHIDNGLTISVSDYGDAAIPMSFFIELERIPDLIAALQEFLP